MTKSEVVLGFLRKVKPSTWDAGAYALGLYCLAHHAGLL